MGGKAYELGTGSTCCKDVVGGGWQDAVIWTQDLVFEVGTPAGLPCKVFVSLHEPTCVIVPTYSLQ